MILTLRNNKITVHQNAIPESVYSVHIKYEFELGTNHLNPVLYINDNIYKGDDINIPLDYGKPVIYIKVELLDSYNRPVKVYTGTFNYYKTCTIGDADHVNLYRKITQLEEKITKLEEKGEVI